MRDCSRENQSPSEYQGAYNVFGHISNSYYDLTKSEKILADFVLNNKVEIQLMSISELAMACDLADATITRFCRKLGLSGFHAFKIAVAKAVALEEKPKIATAEFMSELDIPYGHKALSKLAADSFLNNNEALRQTLELLKYSELQKVVQALHEAEHVYCMGQGGSAITAQEAYSLFTTVSPKFTFTSDSHIQALTSALLTEKHVVLYFCYSGSTTDLLDLLEFQKDRKFTFVLITRYLNSSAAKKANYVLEVGSRENPLRSGSVPARIAQLFLIDILFQAFIEQDEAFYRSNQARTNEALSSKLL